ncbi:MAG: ABC transporter ATP-binding protein [Aureliella sp.]
MTTLVLENITKRFTDSEVLSSISFTVAAGERIVVAGESGSGKTTLLRIIAGLEQPNSGRLKLGELDATKWPANRRKMAVVFQDYATYPRLTVAENLTVALVGGSITKAEKEERLKEIVDWLELDGLLRRLPTELSGGQLQRVALGKALMARPDILLLDEPFSQLDVRLADQLRRLLDMSHQRYGVTQIMVTHNPLDALRSADKLAILDRGKLTQFAPPAEIRQRPLTRFAAELTSLCGLNLLPAALVGREGRAGDGCVAFRPEHVRQALPDGARANDYASVRCRLGSVRDLGVVCLQEAHVGEHKIAAACSPETAPADGQEVTWFVRHDNVLTFCD